MECGHPTEEYGVWTSNRRIWSVDIQQKNMECGHPTKGFSHECVFVMERGSMGKGPKKKVKTVHRRDGN